MANICWTYNHNLGSQQAESTIDGLPGHSHPYHCPSAETCSGIAQHLQAALAESCSLAETERYPAGHRLSRSKCSIHSIVLCAQCIYSDALLTALVLLAMHSKLTALRQQIISDAGSALQQATRSDGRTHTAQIAWYIDWGAGNRCWKDKTYPGPP